MFPRSFVVLFTEQYFKVVMHEVFCVLLERISVYLLSQEWWKQYSKVSVASDSFITQVV
jgi:hypothetical protein